MFPTYSLPLDDRAELYCGWWIYCQVEVLLYQSFGQRAANSHLQAHRLQDLDQDYDGSLCPQRMTARLSLYRILVLRQFR